MPPTVLALAERQATVDAARANGTLDPEQEWRNGRQSGPFTDVVSTLTVMAGERDRCMYCVDSHGGDVDHFKPKKRFPECMFRWRNLLLSCTVCGRLKGEKFPVDSANEPLLVDPTADDPWLWLDFDPDTGNVMARYDVVAGKRSSKGDATVELLHLDRREAMSVGYRRTFKRIQQVVESALAGGSPNAAAMIGLLREADDHGLLEWCFSDRGRQLSPFNELFTQRREVWEQCAAALGAPNPH